MSYNYILSVEDAKNMIKYFKEELHIPIETLLIRYQAKNAYELRKMFQKYFFSIERQCCTYKMRANLDFEWQELKIAYTKFFYEITLYAYNEYCQNRHEQIDEEIMEEFALEGDREVRLLKQELDTAVYVQQCAENKKINQYYVMLKRKEKENKKDWKITDAPSNEIDWEKVDYFEFVENQTELE